MAEADVSLFMRLHLGDWLRVTQGMSAEEVGVHMCLMAAAWQGGGKLPDDQERLSRLSRLHLDRFSTVFRAIEHLWPVVDGFRVAQGMVEQIEKAKAAKAAAIARGKAGGKAPHPTQRKPPNRVEVEPNSKPFRGEGRDGIDTPTSDLRLDPDLTPPPAASVSVSQGSLFASGSGSKQPSCQKEPTEADQVRKVFDHYRTHHKRAFPNPIRESKEWRNIAARLREGHSVENLCDAIDGYHRSPFHCGENEHHRQYLALELIMRDGSHVEAGLGFAEQAGGTVMSVREMRGKRAGQNFVAKVRELRIGGNTDGR